MLLRRIRQIAKKSSLRPVRKERFFIPLAKTPAFSILLLLYIAIFLLQSFFPQAWLQHVMAGCALIACLAALNRARRSALLPSLFLAGCGFLLMMQGNPQPLDWSKAVIHNAPLLSLVLTVPLLSSILAFEPYPQYLSRITAGQMTSPFRFYAVVAAMVTFLSCLLNLASLHFVHQLLRGTADKCPSHLFPRALARGFTPNVMWSPSFISVALAIQYAGISWFTVAPVGISLALASMGCSLLVGWFEYGKLPDFAPAQPATTETAIDNRTAKTGLLKLLCQTSLLISMIILLEYTTKKSALILVPLISFIGPVVLAVIYGKTGTYSLQFRSYLKEKLSKMHNETLLFSAIGFFGYALARSEIPAQIPLLVSHFGLDTPLKLSLLIVASIGLLSLLGIHPMITIAAIAVSLPPGSIPLSGRELAGAFLTGYVLYSLCSPFSAINLILSSLTRLNPLVVGLKQNFCFALLNMAVSIAIILFLFTPQ